jgi:polar amino acid transport system substrate-binding protein
MPLSSRRALIAGAAVVVASRARAAEPLDVFTADIRPLSIPGDGRRGLVLDVVAEAIRAAGREPRFTFLPFNEAMERARTTPGGLVTPLARTPQREPLFTWVGRVVDVPQAMGTLTGRPVADMAAARALPRVGVIRGGQQGPFLRENGFDNLVVLETGRDLAMALAEGRIDAWYSTAPEIALQFEAIGRAGGVRVGPPLQTAPIWLAGSLDAGNVPVAPLRDGLARLDADGTTARTYAAYVAG